MPLMVVCPVSEFDCDAEGWIFLNQTQKRVGHFILIGLASRLDGHFDDGVRKFHAFRE